MFVTNWISTTKIQKISEITNFFRHYFLSRTEVKIYLHIWLEAPIPTIAVKLLPERGEELREKFNAFSPAYHLNKKHWNDIFIEDTFPPEMIQGWIRESYDLVKRKLPKSTLEHLAP